jgi:[acyl-carrier-protein] S-malonyltransferase
MGKDYYDAHPEAREMYKSANRVLGFDITGLSFTGDLDELTKTHNAQPAILLHSLAVLSVLSAAGVRPRIVAGHSVGEFSALVAAGYFKPMDALLIVRKRGELMYEAGLEKPGTMASIMGADEGLVDDSVGSASSEGVVVIANYNSPEQFVISGEMMAVERAVEVARQNGARRVMMLQVSGAFHSPLMEDFSRDLQVYMRKFERGRLRVPWIANVSGQVVVDETEVLELITRQLYSPVQWVASMLTLMDSDSGPVLEVGPGKVLTGLMKRIGPGAKVYPLTTVGGMEEAVRAVC